MDLSAIAAKTERYAIGLMSGTSSDGIDAVLVRIKGTGPQLLMKLIAHRHFPYTPGFRDRLISEHLTAKEVCLLNFEVGQRLAEAAKALLPVAEEEGVEVDFVASHGHTVGHYPPPQNSPHGTMQIGEPACIAEATGLPVVSDFRPRDMAAGGQGAPLVPYADWLLFRKLEHPTACLNLGGIGNFTVVSKELADVIAFDTGPANMAIDGAVRLLSRGELEFDKDGQAAAEGTVVEEFLEYLLGHRFFSVVPPKSTGREEFGASIYLRDALAARSKDHEFNDLVATVTLSVARSVADAFKRFIAPRFDVKHIIVGGGGAKNTTLMRWIQRELPGVRVFTSDQYGIPTGAREAIAFAILGNETVCGTPSNVPQATGARGPVLLGKITLG
jgi:anhydro-N-acetylmuramic acid kinase